MIPPSQLSCTKDSKPSGYQLLICRRPLEFIVSIAANNISSVLCDTGHFRNFSIVVISDYMAGHYCVKRVVFIRQIYYFSVKHFHISDIFTPDAVPHIFTQHIARLTRIYTFCQFCRRKGETSCSLTDVQNNFVVQVHQSVKPLRI